MSKKGAKKERNANKSPKKLSKKARRIYKALDALES